jgi:predicted kinase
LTLAEPVGPVAARSAARVRARALWLHALSELEEPGRRPCLVLLAGLPGTGKSTLSRGLTERAGFTVIRSDEVRKELAGRVGQASSPAAFGEDIYTPEWDERTYAECLRRAEVVVFQAGRMIVDASFRDESRRRLFLDAARGWGVAGRMLHLRADADVVRRRLDHRRDDASDAGRTVYEEAVRRWEESGTATRAATVEIDAGGTPEQTLGDALDALRQSGLIDEST